MRPSLCSLLSSGLAMVVGAAVGGGGAALGQTTGPVIDIQSGEPVLYPSYVTEYAGMLYFRGSTYPRGTNTELWRSDGQTAERVADIVPGENGSSPGSLVVYNGKLYFNATGATGGIRLWQYDPVGGAQMAPGSATQASLPEEMTVFNGQLYYRATRFGSPGNIGTELWRFDGTTQTPLDVYAGSGSSYPQHFTLYNGLLYFNACGTPGQGTELWRYDGMGMPEEAARIYPNNGSSPEHMAVYSGSLYFSAYDGEHGRELWRFDGTQATLAADIVPGGAYSSSNPSNLVVYGDKLYFCADDGVHGNELWSFDGAQAQMVAEINPTPDPGNGDTFLMDSSPADFVIYNDVLYFSADDGTHGRELWSYNGVTVALVMDINPGPYGSGVSELTVYNGRLFFSADAAYVPGLYAFQPVAWSLRLPEQPPALVSAQSVKTHAGVPYGIPLALTGAATSEPRMGGPNQIVLTYDRAVIARPFLEVSAIGATPMNWFWLGDTALVINLTGLVNRSCVAIVVRGVASAADPTAVAPPHVVRVRARICDVTDDGRVLGPSGLRPGDPGFEDSDVSQFECYGVPPMTPDNFKYDINADGVFHDMSDLNYMKAYSDDPALITCSSADADGDGVDDLVDECPNTVAGAGVNGVGCPAEIRGDFDRDGDVDSWDYSAFADCVSGAGVLRRAACAAKDFDADEDVDLSDFGMFQRCFSGAGRAAAVECDD